MMETPTTADLSQTSQETETRVAAAGAADGLAVGSAEGEGLIEGATYES